MDKQEIFLENCEETGMDNAHQNHLGLTVLEMQAWSYKLETKDLKTESILAPTLTSQQNKTLMSSESYNVEK